MEETTKKDSESIEKPSKKREKVKVKLYFWLQNKLKKYDILEKPEGSLDYWFVDSIKKPLFKWFIRILLTSIPIFLLMICFGWFKVEISIGIAIAWFLVIEFVKDMKRIK